MTQPTRTSRSEIGTGFDENNDVRHIVLLLNYFLDYMYIECFLVLLINHHLMNKCTIGYEIKF
jgi:hypothetical protein